MSRKHVNVALFVPHKGCPHRCSFCDQRTISGQSQPLTAAQVTAACETAVRTMDTAASEAEIAFFGGSFTAIDTAYRTELLKAAYPFVKAGYFKGIRVSTRPDCVDDTVLSQLKAYGVTAVELGAQSMVDTVLALNERGHTAADTVRAAQAIRLNGLSLGLQMMTGLYGDTDEGAWQTARAIAALRPDTVRIYPTVVLRGTTLAALYESGAYVPPSWDDTVRLCAGLLRYFECEQGIPVIRLGLHAEPSVEQNRLAGAYHPAFRDVCEGRIYYETARSLLKESFSDGGAVILRVSPVAISRMTGQKRCNIDSLQQEGYAVRVISDESVPLWQIKAERWDS